MLFPRLLTVLAAVLAGACLAQTPVDPDQTAPNAVIDIHKHPMGADMVNVTMSAPDYPAELLKSQIAAMGAELHSDPRGIAVYVAGSDPKLKFLKGSFAIDGIIDREHGAINLQPIVRAFLGAPEPFRVSCLIVTLDGESPVDKQTLMEYSSKAVALKMKVVTAPKGLEYRIVSLTQDPKALEIPSRYVAPETAPKKPKEASGGPSRLALWILLGVSGAAALALVYFVLSGRTARGTRGRTGRT